MFAPTVFGRIMSRVDCAPWGASAGRHLAGGQAGYLVLARRTLHKPLYTPEQKIRRDTSAWTMVQGVLAPLQFLVFAVSLSLVIRYLATGGGEQAATVSVVVKTLVLYTIMVTGAIWEHEVFGKYLFAPAFFWEDAVSMVVIALHTAYLAALLSGALDTQSLMLLALAAYATYVLNATQFVLKLRAARMADDKSWASANTHGPKTHGPNTHGLGHA